MKEGFVNKSASMLGQADPKELWREIASRISDETLLKPDLKILIPGCGYATEALAIANRMYKLGVPKDEIKSKFYLLDKYKSPTETLKLWGWPNVIQADFLTWEPTMRFDWTAGNPPYTDGSKGNAPIYQEFIKKAFEISDNVAMIVPSGFAVSDEKHGKMVRDKVFNNDTTHVKFLPSDTFETATVETLYFISEKNNNKGTAITNRNNVQYKTSNYNYIFEDKMLYSILQKCGTDSTTKSWIKFNKIENSKTTDTPINTLTKLSHNGNVFEDTNSIDRYHKEHRVVTSFLPNSPLHLDVVTTVEPGTSVKDGYTVSICDSKTEAINLANYIKSKLVLFIHSQTKTSRTLRTPQLKFIPKIDLSTQLSDTDIYNYFGLTQDEINYIEENV